MDQPAWEGGCGTWTREERAGGTGLVSRLALLSLSLAQSSKVGTSEPPCEGRAAQTCSILNAQSCPKGLSALDSNVVSHWIEIIDRKKPSSFF